MTIAIRITNADKRTTAVIGVQTMEYNSGIRDGIATKLKSGESKEFYVHSI